MIKRKLAALATLIFLASCGSSTDAWVTVDTLVEAEEICERYGGFRQVRVTGLHRLTVISDCVDADIYIYKRGIK